MVDNSGISAVTHHGARFDVHSPFRAMIAGVLTGWIELSVGYPIEYLKTTVQLHGRNASAWGSLEANLRRYGVVGLYRGVVPLFVGSVPKSAIRFGAFEYAKTQLPRWPPPFSHLLACGLLAGLVEAVVVVTPMETVKVRFIRDRTLENPRFRGYLHGIGDIVRAEGVRGIYRGLAPTVLKQTICQAIRFGTLEYGKERYRLHHDRNAVSVPMHVIGTYGIIAGFMSTILSSPVDVVKTRMQGMKHDEGMWHCAVEVWRMEGLYGFYRGNLLRLVRVCCEVAMVFMVYDKILNKLDHVHER